MAFLPDRLIVRFLPARASVLALSTLFGLAFCLATSGADDANTKSADASKDSARIKKEEPKRGLLVKTDKAFPGYTLISPMRSKESYLLDLDGRVVRTWKSDYTPALSAYLLPDGHLLRPAALEGKDQPFGGPGAGGKVQEFDWEGNLVWDFKYTTDKRLPHHDVCRLPNGDTLLIVWEKKLKDEAIAAGRKPDSLSSGHLLPDCLLEVKPTGKTTGEIVWEWHTWDHLVQEHDPSKANFGTCRGASRACRPQLRRGHS